MTQDIEVRLAHVTPLVTDERLAVLLAVARHFVERAKWSVAQATSLAETPDPALRMAHRQAAHETTLIASTYLHALELLLDH